MDQNNWQGTIVTKGDKTGAAPLTTARTINRMHLNDNDVWSNITSHDYSHLQVRSTIRILCLNL